jgi:hypothetical protein
VAATDVQMQTYADQRIRVRAETFRALVNSSTDDKNNITDEYARASSAIAWADARTDGPAHLLQAGNNANPDDFLNYNALITTFLALIAGTASPTEVAAFPGQWAVFQRACVRSG